MTKKKQKSYLYRGVCIVYRKKSDFLFCFVCMLTINVEDGLDAYEKNQLFVTFL